jgi:hypothetical protein
MMRIVHLGPGDPADLDAEARELLYAARAEADHLRTSLAEAEALLDAVEDELRAVTRRSLSDAEWIVASAQAVPAIVRARTLTRQALFGRSRAGSSQGADDQDLRMAEVSFAFVLGMRSLRREGER